MSLARFVSGFFESAAPSPNPNLHESDFFIIPPGKGKTPINPTAFIDYSFKYKVPLCEDLDDVVLREGESCYSDCGATLSTQLCPKRVIEPGLKFLKQQSCRSHTECVGREDRLLCEAVPDERAER